MTEASFPAGTRETLLFLATAGLVVPAFTKLRISPVLGFLFAGIALGPYGIGALVDSVPALQYLAISHQARIASIAEFGVVFLLFMLGLELSFARLATLRRLIFGLGPIQVVASALGLGVAGMALGVAPSVALVIGGAVALSSTAIVVPVLAERKRLNSPTGRMAFALLLFQDLAVAPLLFAVSVLADHEPGSLGLKLALTLAPAILAVGALVVVGRLILRPLFHLVAVARSTELFTAASLLVIVGTGAITAASGLSMAIGAFIAGLLLAETEYRREIEVTIEPFKGLLLGLFFVSVGTELDLSRLFATPALVLGMAVGLVAIKALVLYGAARLLKMPRRVSAEVSLLLAPGGEFAFVLINQAAAGALLPETISASLLVAVTLTMIATPFMARGAERLARRLPAARNTVPLPPPDDGQARVLIVGYGRVGQLVAEMVTGHNLPYLAIDDDPAVVARARDAGVPITFGDATRPDFLRLCGLAQARALVVTVSTTRVVEQVVAAGRGERADLTIVARARDAAHAAKLYEAGVTDAVPETIEASLQLSEAVLVDIGIPMGFVIASIHEKRDQYRRMLNASEPQGPRRERRAIRRPTAESKA
ncbi:cation:proton antiporter [Lichenihabitans sp. Uapishka_5]|uniref:cation:proton antiporter domain-containing protein n=1 Tax=Lichenihabitans sp. Uapishka_5 TaxID=3037302 RepID=UPI0029E7CD66|nr:cation:proton antiporter [Lichenihabitans sp. Uapishka_5]MDX7951702.1 cation:proton antiporter [Lichenihabitans sp. Uapishka_5]